MCLRNRLLLALSAGVFLLNLPAGAATGQSAVKPAQATGGGLLRSELSLAGRTASVAYVPTLNAKDPAHRAVVSPPPGTASSRARVGTLETNGSLRIGSLDVGKQDPAGTRYGLWLQGATSGWQLEITDAATADAAGDPVMLGQIPLTREAAESSPNFVAALVPENDNTARLVLRWGEYGAATEMVFTDPPKPRRVDQTGLPNTTINRTHDEDTSALARARLLAQRNETALVVATGHRLSVSFQRTLGARDRANANNDGSARTLGLPVDGPDFARLGSTDGAIVMLTQAAVPRLKIETPLRFGRALIATGNQVPGFPGSYGMWLKRAGSGWRLVLNHEPDAWGSQHDPKFDAAEIALTHSEGHAASRPFAVALAPTAADRGRLLIIWGPHEWGADFVVSDF
jgi:hypothetical protein